LEELPSGFTRVLAVGAHPDDAEFLAGATLAAFVARGAEVHLVVCTDGGKGGRGVADAVAVRKGEQARAAAVLGLSSVAELGLPDGELEANPALRRALVEAIRRRRPEVVLGHDPRTRWTSLGDRVGLGHSDHRAAGQALLDAIYPRALSPNFHPELGLDPWCPREVWLFDSESPDRVVDVTESWEEKAAALRAHASQEATAGGLTEPALARARQLGADGRLGEAFVRLKIW